MIRLIFILTTLLPLFCLGQRTTMTVRDAGGNLLEEHSFQYSNEKEKRDNLNRIRLDLVDEGYLEAGFDSVSQDTAVLHLGKKYSIANVYPGNVDEEILTIIGFRARLYQNRPFSVQSLGNLYEKLLRYYENHGKPFATVGMDSIKVDSAGAITGQLLTDPGPFVQIDSIIIKGDAKISRQLLYNYLSISPDDPYDQSKINAISLRIREIGYLSEIKPAEVVFLPNKARLYLYLKGENANQLNGILGVLPDRETRKVTITGDARVRLKNALGRGDLIDINWRKLQQFTQDMQLHFNYPYIFNIPMGVDVRFNLYKKDTTFLELKPRIMIQFLMRGGNYVGLYVKNHSSRLIQPEDYSSVTSLPSFADTKTTLYGISLFTQHLDYQINPRRGYSISVDGGLGRKRILPLPELDEKIYDEIELNSIQYDVILSSELFLPLFKRSTFLIGGKAAVLYNEQMFSNEMYRIGGIRTLRGFDEESIRASSYAIGTLEYRFLLERNSNIYAFFDLAWYEDRTRGNYSRDIPYGFGAGISFQTKPGIFSINYALGSQKGNPILIKAAKVHFGFVNYF